MSNNIEIRLKNVNGVYIANMLQALFIYILHIFWHLAIIRAKIMLCFSVKEVFININQKCHFFKSRISYFYIKIAGFSRY